MTGDRIESALDRLSKSELAIAAITAYLKDGQDYARVTAALNERVGLGGAERNQLEEAALRAYAEENGFEVQTVQLPCARVVNEQDRRGARHYTAVADQSSLPEGAQVAWTKQVTVGENVDKGHCRRYPGEATDDLPQPTPSAYGADRWQLRRRSAMTHQGASGFVRNVMNLAARSGRIDWDKNKISFEVLVLVPKQSN